MEKITPYLWFDTQAKEAAHYYVEAFANSRIKSSTILSDTPSGTVDMLSIELMGQEFGMISAGPYFKINPSISFLVYCETSDELTSLWSKLSDGGTALMPLQEYPFSKQYGWIQDRFGVSWQLMIVGDRPVTRRIIPTLMFVGDKAGKAEEAIGFYTSIFHNTSIDHVMRYTADQTPDKEGTIAHEGFTLEGEQFAAMDSAREHSFAFNEAVSFIVHCDNQEEIDYYWEKLSAVPEAEQCGWLKDMYGVSWQIVPRVMDEMMSGTDAAAKGRVAQAFLQMKKFDIATLEKAYKGE